MGNKSIGELKREALRSLKGKWGIAVLVCFLASVITSGISLVYNISSLPSIISGDFFANIINADAAAVESGRITILSNLSQLINLLIGGSITFGLSRFFIKLTRDENPQIEDLFSGFRYFGKNFLIQLIIGIFSFLWSLLVYLPMIIIMIILMVITFSSYANPNILNFEQIISGTKIGLIVVVGLLVIISSIILNILLLKYALAFYIYNDNKDALVMDCINESKEMMRGHKGRLFLLNLSFIGWSILSVITLGIGFLWLAPYINATTASFYNDLKGPEPEETTLEISGVETY